MEIDDLVDVLEGMQLSDITLQDLEGLCRNPVFNLLCDACIARRGGTTPRSLFPNVESDDEPSRTCL